MSLAGKNICPPPPPPPPPGPFDRLSYLGEAENVVNEEQHILTLVVTEVLSNGETCSAADQSEKK